MIRSEMPRTHTHKHTFKHSRHIRRLVAICHATLRRIVAPEWMHVITLHTFQQDYNVLMKWNDGKRKNSQPTSLIGTIVRALTLPFFADAHCSHRVRNEIKITFTGLFTFDVFMYDSYSCLCVSVGNSTHTVLRVRKSNERFEKSVAGINANWRDVFASH